ncbi:MAG TPA: DNA polymerase III subunit delta [Vicinamibacterales bacterium]|nr:DNA polymerase III subunit delta [Vicinamibacterales bacterium]
MSTVAEIRKQIKAGKTGPLYLLEGDDLQSRHDLALEFANIVEEGLQAFNVQSFYANEATSASGRDQLIGALLANARTLPMMAPRRVIMVHEADRLLAPKRARDDEEGDGDLAAAKASGAKASKASRVATSPAEELEAYIENPEPMTTMVFVSGPLDANRRVVKLLRKHGDVVDCGTLHDAREAAIWITKRLEKDELTIEPKAISLLIASTGLTLGRIRPEVEKLILYAAGEATVTVAHVRDLVIPQEESEGTFALMDAVQNANAPRALREVSALIEAGIQPPVILGQLRAATIRLRPDARVKNALDAVFRTDQAIKSSAGTPQHLLECLVVELCSR